MVDLSGFLFPKDPSSSLKMLCMSLKSADVSVASRSPSENPTPPVHDLKNAIAWHRVFSTSASVE